MSKEKITVYRPGTHAGKRYKPGPEGITLEVSASQAKALRDRGADKPPTGVTDSAAAESAAVPPAAPANVPAGAGVGVGVGNSVPEVPADKAAAARAPRG